MAKIDTSGWREFRLIDVFHMNNTKSIVQKAITPDSGTIPYVTAQAGNNGILTYINCPLEWLDKGNCIMIGGKTLTFSYQEKDFCSNDSHNITLHLRDESEATEINYLFLIAALKRALYQKYSWGDSVSMQKIKDDTFLLPVDTTGAPDWNYMERYMKEVIRESETCLENLRHADTSKNPFNLTNWKPFHLYDDELFEIDMGTKLDRSKMKGLNPCVNFVGRGNTNNGITACVDKIEGLPPYAAGNLTLSMGGDVGSCFIQPDPFYTSQNVIVLIPKKEMSFAVKQFIATVIYKESQCHYKAFVDELNRHIKTDFSFYLPVDTTGSPDWAYMEHYMSAMLRESQTRLKCLR